MKGVCKPCRIALGAVAPTPIRIKKVEEMINGEKFEEELVREVAQTVSEEIKPISDVRSTAEYRGEVSKNLVEDVLNIAWKRAWMGEG